MKELFASLPVKGARFLLPDKKYMGLWPVVACDQYTSQKHVWEDAAKAVGDKPSALKLILPECWLSQSDIRVPAACAEMEKYLENGVLTEQVNGMVLLERTTGSGTKTGLLLTLDLEDYSYEKGTLPLIRPTEGTVKERIPPRLKVRRDALMELSHILILIDDPENTVLGPLKAKKDALRALYDQELPMNGGHLSGWAVEEEEDLNGVAEAFCELKRRLNKNGILLAVGDGNHSLATAKAHWEQTKAGLGESERAEHPARFATVEINNIYDDALMFEPIHRVVFKADEDRVLNMLKAAEPVESAEKYDAVIIGKKRELRVRFARPLHTLPVGTVQQLLDRAGAEVDYVHGEDAVREIVQRETETCGILLPAMPKALLFPSVEKDGPLPRKTFSMGEANEKRFYMEARIIR